MLEEKKWSANYMSDSKYKAQEHSRSHHVAPFQGQHRLCVFFF
jgi:hypothetical protein